jgi:hypothetical protein
MGVKLLCGADGSAGLTTPLGLRLVARRGLSNRASRSVQGQKTDSCNATITGLRCSLDHVIGERE